MARITGAGLDSLIIIFTNPMVVNFILERFGKPKGAQQLKEEPQVELSTRENQVPGTLTHHTEPFLLAISSLFSKNE